MDYKGNYELAELENSNLRKCLKWAAAHLKPEQIRQLRDMIKGPLEEGGVVRDNLEQAYEEAVEFRGLAVKAADLLDQAIAAIEANTPDEVIWFKEAMSKGRWVAQADNVSYLLREYEPPSPEANLAEIRNMKDIIK